jgi:hypothetical protein
MDEIKLTDFGVDELQVAVGLFEEQMDTLNNKLQQISCFPDGEVRQELTTEYNRQFEIVQLWKVQLENALGFVSQRETMQSN